MASIRKRNGRWQVQVRKSGHNVTRTFSTSADAQLWAKLQEVSIEKEGLPSRPDKLTRLYDVLKRYEAEVIPRKSKVSGESFMVRVILRHPMAMKSLASLKAQDLADFRDSRLKVAKASTVLRHSRLILHALKVARDEWGLVVPLTDLQRVKLPTAQVIPISRVTQGSITQFLSASDQQACKGLSLAVRLAVETGLRRGELLNLTWTDVDLQGRQVLVRHAKNGQPRHVPLSSQAIAVLEQVHKPSGLVIGMTVDAFKLAFRRARAKAGTSFRFHDLRHEAISRLFEKGLSVPEAKFVSGHKTMSQLDRYAHADAARIAVKLVKGVVAVPPSHRVYDLAYAEGSAGTCTQAVGRLEVLYMELGCLVWLFRANHPSAGSESVPLSIKPNWAKEITLD